MHAIGLFAGIAAHVLSGDNTLRGEHVDVRPGWKRDQRSGDHFNHASSLKESSAHDATAYHAVAGQAKQTAHGATKQSEAMRAKQSKQQTLAQDVGKAQKSESIVHTTHSGESGMSTSNMVFAGVRKVEPRSRQRERKAPARWLMAMGLHEPKVKSVPPALIIPHDYGLVIKVSKAPDLPGEPEKTSERSWLGRLFR
jgi:hypothetical protein